MLMNRERKIGRSRSLPEADPSYLVVPVPVMSNGAAASACSELPSSRRKRTGVVWSLPPKKVDKPVIEYIPVPDLIPSVLALVVSVTVHAPIGAGVAKHVPVTAAACVRGYSTDVIVGLPLSILPASPTGAPFGGLSRYPM